MTLKEAQTTIDEKQETLNQIGDLVDKSLDPILTREEIVERLQQIHSLLEDEEDEDEDDDTDTGDDD